MTGLVDIYRLRHGEKVSALRLLAYVLFGYAVSGLFHPKAYVINTLIVLGGLLFASLLNDYYDYALLGERNAIGNVLLKGQAKKNIVPFLVLIPWLVALGLFFLLLKLPVTNLALLLLWASFLLSFVYAFPPFRLKERKVLGTVTPPLGIFILFFEGLTLLAMPNMFGWMMAVIVFLFAWYLEFLHLVDDSLQRHETIKISTGRAMRSLLFAIRYLLFHLPGGFCVSARFIV